MFIEKFIKKQFISFYFEEKYKVLLEIVKNRKIIESKTYEFDTKIGLESFIKEQTQLNAQTYVSSILDSINQGVISSCNEKDYKKYEIDLKNVKIVCIDNEYSFYTSSYDIEEFLKSFSIELDFLYSFFVPIDYFAKNRNNVFYLLILKEYLIVLGYENNKPIFGDIYLLKEESEKDLEEDDLDVEDINEEELDSDIEEITDIEDIEDIEDNIDDIDDIEEITLDDSKKEEKEPSIKLDIEMEIIKFLEKSLKEYYRNYSTNFIEEIVLLNTVNLNKTIEKLIEDELFIKATIKSFDLLKTINRISIESI